MPLNDVSQTNCFHFLKRYLYHTNLFHLKALFLSQMLDSYSPKTFQPLPFKLLSAATRASGTIGAATTNRSFIRSVLFSTYPPDPKQGDGEENPSQSIASQSGPKQGGGVDPFLNTISTFICLFESQLVQWFIHPTTFPGFLYWVQRISTGQICLQTPLDWMLLYSSFVGWVLFEATVPRFFSFDATLHWRHENVMDNMKV